MLFYTDLEIKFNPKKLSFKDKLVWTFKIWFNKESILKIKR